MRITRVQIKGLFGIFDHDIHLTNRERVTIVHGPNGFGKTVLLRMISALFEGDTTIFERIPFGELRVSLDDGSTALLRAKREGSSKQSQQVKLTYSFVTKDNKTLNTTSYPVVPDVPPAILDRVDRFVPGSLRRFETGWVDSKNQYYSLAEILKKFPGAIDALPRKFRPRSFADLAEHLNVFFVETKRLDAQQEMRRRTQDEYYIYEESSQVTNLRVDQYSLDIARRIKSTLADYAKHSQESDRTFPERLVRFIREGGKTLPEKEILERISELEAKRQRLISLGFLDSESGLRDLTEEDVRKAPEALSIYVGDVQEKLRVFDDLAQRAGKLIDIINDRFNYKELKVHREAGFRAITGTGEVVQLEDLSSGEQHELVLLYELLFRAPRKGLVLVDEPEISLHVGWQSRFLSDLISILELTNSYAIVATHSPVVIGARWDLAVELKGPTVSDVEENNER